jgi:hypothetical protein
MNEELETLKAEHNVLLAVLEKAHIELDASRDLFHKCEKAYEKAKVPYLAAMVAVSEASTDWAVARGKLCDMIGEDEYEDWRRFPDPEVRKAVDARRVVANDPDATPRELTALCGDSVWDIRRDVGDHQNTPVEILGVLSKDDNDIVRMAVARNPRTSLETVRVLVDDDNRWVSELARERLGHE